MSKQSREKIPILLLKTKTSPTDGYHDHFTSSGEYIPIFVPVLEHRLISQSLTDLKLMIQKGGLQPNSPSAAYGGIIFTSQRAVEAFANVVNPLGESAHALKDLVPRNFPLYVVGPATARTLRSMNLDCEICGEKTGNGEALAEYILDDYNARQPLEMSRKLPLLFLVGEQRRDIIPKTLEGEGLPTSKRIRVVEMVVYKTGEMDSFPSDFASSMERARTLNPKIQWIVIFSPTGCKAVLEHLNLCKSSAQDGVQVADERIKDLTTRIVTIGPTTKAFLNRQFQMNPDACAEYPSPEGLLAAISNSEQRQ